MDIRHDNIIYIRDISSIGGVETFGYEMVKKYKDLDIAVVYKEADSKQLERIKKYCRTYKHRNQDIYCKVAIINWDVSIIDYIKEGKIYQTVHADYENAAYKWKPPEDDRICQYIGVTKHVCESYERLTGHKCVSIYNPLTIEKEKPCLTLVSATRLSVIKGKDRMIKLAKALDKAGINYIWYIFTNDTDEIDNPNIIYMKPRLDVSRWIERADYVVQLSDTEALSYTINEALYRNIPVIVTPLPYLDEIGVKDGVNSYIMKFDCSNVDEIAKKVEKIPSFIFTKLEDKYNTILAKGKSRYQEEKNKRFLVEATDKAQKHNMWDSELTFEKFTPEEIAEGARYIVKPGEQWIVDIERKDFLIDNGFAVLVKEVKQNTIK